MAPSLPRPPSLSLPLSESLECYLRSGQLDGREGSHQPSGVLALEVAHHQVTARLGLWLLSLLRVLVGQVVLRCGARERGEGRGGWEITYFKSVTEREASFECVTKFCQVDTARGVTSHALQWRESENRTARFKYHEPCMRAGVQACRHAGVQACRRA